MYHPSNGSPRTANTWGYFAVHEKHEANRAATASHGEPPRLPSREGKKRQKLKGRENSKGDKTLWYLGVVKPVTPKEDVPLRGNRSLEGGEGLITAGESSKSSDMLYSKASSSDKEEELISASASDSRDCKILFPVEEEQP
ncbi:hypothetical protein AVEN_96254-1 [Araneus ventricosus]|uniref:Uncharacterized protein n=1 Tax=Araneus ventricosus TaxID=182803 RepID=A0A4Y2WJN9_ARAVE|nr:hypothetical protein AVEN_96254-1 [Araneus ventricosus]